MAANSKIEWCDHTFNPWIGCTKVSPGCLHCYAEQSTPARVMRHRGQETWGKGAQRSRTSEANWKEPLKWNQEAEASNQRPRVFCASLADVFDDEVDIMWFIDLLHLIYQTQHLDWLLCTKRPQKGLSRIDRALALLEVRKQPETFALRQWLTAWLNGKPPANVWMGTTVEDQERADERIPHLLRIPAKVRFLSCEPLLGPVNLTGMGADIASIHWLICGGESGPQARPMHPDWARGLRVQCEFAKVPFFFKQWGEWVRDAEITHEAQMGNESSIPTTIVPYGGDEDSTNYRRVYRVGKKLAGRVLDGRTWDEFPKMIS